MIYLYIKQHDITKLKYFGRTSRKNPEKYLGSGTKWRNHIHKHGKEHVKTLHIYEFDNQEEATKFALEFSHEHNIVESNEWANLMVEDAIIGYGLGHPKFEFTEDQRKKMSAKSKARWSDPAFKKNMSEKHKARFVNNPKLKTDQSLRLKNEFWTEERRQKHSNLIKGRPGYRGNKGKPKPEGFGEKLSRALKGKPKSAAQIKKMTLPKNRICRVIDRKEMSVNHYTRWIKSFIV